MTRQGIIEKSTGDLTNFGYTDFTDFYNQTTEALVGDVPEPPKVRGNPFEELKHRWTSGSAWVVLADTVSLDSIDLEEEYKNAKSAKYAETTYSGSTLTDIDVYDTPGKIVKLFNKNFIYIGSQLTSGITTRLIDDTVLIKTYEYSAGKLTSIHTTYN